jgi:hypothetical protein
LDAVGFVFEARADAYVGEPADGLGRAVADALSEAEESSALGWFRQLVERRLQIREPLLQGALDARAVEIVGTQADSLRMSSTGNSSCSAPYPGELSPFRWLISMRAASRPMS